MVKKKTIHEELFEKFNIDINDLSEDQPLKLINKDMKKEIIESLIQKLNQQYTIRGNRIVIFLANQQEAEEFSNEISRKMISHINEYLLQKNLNPHEYQRVLNITTLVNDNTLEISF